MDRVIFVAWLTLINCNVRHTPSTQLLESGISLTFSNTIPGASYRPIVFHTICEPPKRRFPPVILASGPLAWPPRFLTSLDPTRPSRSTPLPRAFLFTFDTRPTGESDDLKHAITETHAMSGYPGYHHSYGAPPPAAYPPQQGYYPYGPCPRSSTCVRHFVLD